MHPFIEAVTVNGPHITGWNWISFLLGVVVGILIFVSIPKR